MHIWTSGRKGAVAESIEPRDGSTFASLRPPRAVAGIIVCCCRYVPRPAASWGGPIVRVSLHRAVESGYCVEGGGGAHVACPFESHEWLT